MTPISLTPTVASVSSPSVPGGARARAAVQAGDGGFSAALSDTASASPPPPVTGPRLSATALNKKSESETRAAIHKAAGDFEATCLGQLMTFMTQQVDVDPNFGGGHGEEMFREMLTTEYGKLARSSGTAGIAGPVEREMLRAQGLKPLSSTQKV